MKDMWRDMSSAPKDGTPIMVTNSVMETNGREPVEVIWDKTYRTPLGNRVPSWTNKFGHLVIPDKWMPRPEPHMDQL